jgi:hypothetical protein
VRLIRRLVTFKLGALAGMAAVAVFVRRAMPSVGDEESDELALVAVFDGIELVSRATAFKGGSMLAWFGGIEVDLRNAQLDPGGAQLSVHALFGGVEIKTPPSWRIESDAKAVFGGIAARTPAQDDPAAPLLRLAGAALLGGIDVGSGADVAGESAITPGATTSRRSS